MLKKLVQTSLKAFGFEMRRLGNASTSSREFPFGGYDLEEEARSSIRHIQSHTMVPYARLVVLYQQVAFCEKNAIPGCYVECGTWKGGASGLMALANLKHGQARRQLHLFDSFQGLPEPDAEKDGAQAVAWSNKFGGGGEGKLKPIQGTYESVGTLAVNRDLMDRVVGYDANYLHYHEGWFQDTVPRDAPALGPIAILRLDGDWYESTKVCLNQLYDQVVPGGFVIVDDYNGVEGCKRATDEFINQRHLKAFLSHLDGEGRYWIKMP